MNLPGRRFARAIASFSLITSILITNVRFWFPGGARDGIALHLNLRGDVLPHGISCFLVIVTERKGEPLSPTTPAAWPAVGFRAPWATAPAVVIALVVAVPARCRGALDGFPPRGPA